MTHGESKMGKNSIIGIILIIVSVMIILYANAGISKEERLASRGSTVTQVDQRQTSAADRWKDIPVMKTARFVGYVFGVTGIFLLLAGVFGQPRSARDKGVIYAPRSAHKSAHY